MAALQNRIVRSDRYQVKRKMYMNQSNAAVVGASDFQQGGEKSSFKGHVF